jgi:hypothetical protein
MFDCHPNETAMARHQCEHLRISDGVTHLALSPRYEQNAALLFESDAQRGSAHLPSAAPHADIAQ